MLNRSFLLAAVLTIVSACAQAPVDRAERATEQPKGVTLPSYDTFTLENGMQILLMEKRDVPLVAFEAIVRGGALADPVGKDGTASLVAELMRKGAGGRNAVQFAEAVENVGGVITTGAGQERMVVSGEFMARDASLMLELLGDLLMDPALARGEFDKLRDRSIQQIQAMKDSSLRALTTVYGDAFLFEDHPYARVTMGSEAGLAQVGYADVRRYFIEHVGADRTILAIVGDFDAADMRQKLEQRFGNWRRATGSLPELAAPSAKKQPRVLLVDKPDATQTYFYIGNVGVARDYEQRAALDLVNTVFGGRFTSMLNTKLRVESGLTYGAGSRLLRYSQPGSVAITSFTQTDSTAAAIDLALETLERLHEEGISEEQLASAKAYVLGQFPPRLETGSALAGRLADLRFHGLGRDDVDEYATRVNAVDAETAQAVIDEVYPRRDSLVFVLIGNAAAIRDDVANYGPVTEMRITDPRFSPSR